ncbi:hypothetical protein NG799_02265 [Laspinema sp. D1]|uniref:Uncharacterized protein n=1 Tax=Laspinema palackyanum D2a TaxID=2953684 RepID=A0ABT2MK89_9CYAN|nr:hypothetical protein [Laspinema sp. D2a]
MGIQSWNIETGEQTGGISPHADTHHQGGTDAISAEAIGAAQKMSGDFTFAYGPGWGEFDSSYLARYRRIDKLILLSGLIQRTTTTGRIIATLPEGYRPTSIRVFELYSSSGRMRVDFLTDGQVILILELVGNLIQWISLDGVCFFGN